MQFGFYNGDPLTADDNVCVIDTDKFLAANVNTVGPMSTEIEVLYISGPISINFSNSFGDTLGIQSDCDGELPGN